MKILKLTLENFQGLRSLTLDLDGKNAAIYGDNATGKTTVFNAITWLLFDKSSTGAKNFTPKTWGTDGELHNLDHSVEMLISSQDGEKLTLKKVLHEVYKRKRGSLEEEFSGHTVEYYINGVPAKEKEYSERVDTLCGNVGQALTMPDHFPEVMGWADRRSLLVSICGDVTDEELLTSSDELKELSDILIIPGTDGKRYTVDEFKKIATAKRADINKRIASIPARIDEATKAIPELDEISADTIADKVAQIDALITDLVRRKEGAAPKTDCDKLNELKERKEAARAEHFKRFNESNAAVTADLTVAQSESREAVVKLSRAKNDLADKEAERGRMERLRADLLKEYTEAAALRFPTDSECCPTCRRRFPEDKIDELRTGFAKRRKDRLEEINKRGQDVSKDRIDALVGEIAALRANVSELEADYADKSARVNLLNAKLAVVTPFEYTQTAKDLTKLIEDETARIEEAKRSAGAVSDNIDGQLAELRAAKATEEEKIAKIRLAQVQRQRITELESEEKALGAEFNALERSLYLCDLFTRAKVSALDSRINSRFETVRFRLFEEQVNGGLRDCCDVMIPRADGVLVPYQFANTAARINAGLEIISVLSQHFGVSLPVVVDNAESVTTLRDIPAQVIKLVVSEGDKSLRVEVK